VGRTLTSLRVLADASEVAERARREVLARATRAIRARGAFTIALSGGATPRALYERLAASERVDWARWHVFFGDERCVPPHHADSNAGMVCDALLDRVPIPSRQVHRMRGEAEPVAAAAEYERALLGHFGGPPRFDVVLLGLGADGHTASLFPGSSALAERERTVVATHVDALRAWRITLTPRAIAFCTRARSISTPRASTCLFAFSHSSSAPSPHPRSRTRLRGGTMSPIRARSPRP